MSDAVSAHRSVVIGDEFPEEAAIISTATTAGVVGRAAPPVSDLQLPAVDEPPSSQIQRPQILSPADKLSSPVGHPPPEPALPPKKKPANLLLSNMNEFIPPPLSPRSPRSPMKQQEDGLDRHLQPPDSQSSLQPHQPQGSQPSLIQKPDHPPPPVPKPTGNEKSNESSWLDTIDEAVDSASLSTRSRSSLLYPRSKHSRGCSGGTEAEFDAALDAAVEAAYDDGLEPTSDSEEEVDDVVWKSRRNIELAKRKVRQAELESQAVMAKDRERKRLEEEALHGNYAALNANYEDDEAEEEERILEEMMADFEFDSQSKSALPRQSDSSGISHRTWGSSTTSNLSAAAGTSSSLSTLAEEVEIPGTNNWTSPPVPAHIPPRPPIPSPSVVFQSTSAPQSTVPKPIPPAFSSGTATSGLGGPRSGSSSSLHEKLPSIERVSSPARAHERQLSGRPYELLPSISHERLPSLSQSLSSEKSPQSLHEKQQSLSRDWLSSVSSTQSTDKSPPSSTHERQPSLSRDKLSSLSHITHSNDKPPSPSRENQTPSVLSNRKLHIPVLSTSIPEERNELELVSPAGQRSGASLATHHSFPPLETEISPKNGGEDSPVLSPTISNDFDTILGSPPKGPALHSAAGPFCLRKTDSSTNLRGIKREPTTSTLTSESSTAVPSTVASTSTTSLDKKLFGSSMVSLTQSQEHLNNLEQQKANVFESTMHAPITPDTPWSRSPDAPWPLEACPQSSLLRPYWLMRCLYQTIAHPRGGYLTNKLFVPRAVWQIPGVKLKNVPDKIANCDLLTAGLMKLARTDMYDAEAILEEIQSFENVMDHVQNIWNKKLGSEVGIQGAVPLFRGSSGDDGSTSMENGIKLSAGSGKSYLSSWRKLRSKSSGPSGGAGLVTVNKDATAARDALASMPSLPMTDMAASRAAKRNPALVQCVGPNAPYMNSLMRLFDVVQILGKSPVLWFVPNLTISPRSNCTRGRGSRPETCIPNPYWDGSQHPSCIGILWFLRLSICHE